jgi:DNA polymerase-4
MAQRTILHIDMDAFFAAVEQRRRPELRGKPVVVGGDGDPSKRGVVSTASYEARKFGIHSALPLRTAYRLCPDAVFLPVDVPAYREVSQRMYAILRDTGGRVEPMGLDEACLDATDLADGGEAVARAIRGRIAAELQLTATIGVGPNKLVAKIASGLNKPDGLTVIGADEVEARLGPLPVTVLWGVGPKTAAALKERFGVNTVADLAALSLEDLQAVYGPNQGAHLHRISHGQDDREIVTEWEPSSISRERTFQVDLRRIETIRDMLGRIAADVAADVRSEGYKTANITLKIRFATFETFTRSKTLPDPVDDDATVARTAIELLERVAVNRPVRLLGVRAAKLSPAAPEPGGEGELFR